MKQCRILIILFLLSASQVYAGDVRGAFSTNLGRFESVDFGSEDDNSLIKETIESYYQLDPKPALPPQAETFLFQGEAAVEMAKDKQGFEKAIDEFEKALHLAPWLASAYYNLGIVYEKSEQYHKAALNFERYLWASPGTSDEKDIKKRIIKLKFKEGLAKEEKAEEEALTQKRLKEEESQRLLAAVTGKWTGHCTSWPEPLSYEFSVEEDIVRRRQYLGTASDGEYMGWSGWEKGTQYDFDLNRFSESTWHANENYIWVRSGTLMEEVNEPTGKITCAYKR